MKNLKHSYLSLLISLAVIFFMLPDIAKGQHEDFKPVDDPAELINKINNSSKNSKTIKSGFVQVKRLEFLEEDIISEGKFYFKAENLLRWEYTDPYEYVIIFRDDKILINDNTNIRSFDTGGNRMFTEISGIMLGMVNGTILESDAFRVEYFRNEKNYMLKLFPRVPGISEFLEEIHLYLDKQDYTVDKVNMIEKSGDFTRITFTNKVINESIQDNIFNIY